MLVCEEKRKKRVAGLLFRKNNQTKQNYFRPSDCRCVLGCVVCLVGSPFAAPPASTASPARNAAIPAPPPLSGPSLQTTPTKTTPGNITSCQRGTHLSRAPAGLFASYVHGMYVHDCMQCAVQAMHVDSRRGITPGRTLMLPSLMRWTGSSKNQRLRKDWISFGLLSAK